MKPVRSDFILIKQLIKLVCGIKVIINLLSSVHIKFENMIMLFFAELYNTHEKTNLI